MNKPLCLFVAKSASGKTTIAEWLAIEHGYKNLWSYTTRMKRSENESGHVFVTEEEFAGLQNLVAYTVYNGKQYGATAYQVDESDIYVIDLPGVESLLEKYETDRPIRVLYFDTSICTRIERMVDRGDSDTQIVSRLYNDEQSDWQNQLSKLVWHYKNNLDRDVEMYVIDANQRLKEVMADVKNVLGIADEVAENENCN